MEHDEATDEWQPKESILLLLILTMQHHLSLDDVTLEEPGLPLAPLMASIAATRPSSIS